MPTQVFYNLKKEKKDKIIEAVFSEFANYTFEEASIKRIVEDAGIARGSFYQYFDDLQDCFVFLLKITKLKFQEEQLLSSDVDPNQDFLLILKEKFKKRLLEAFKNYSSKKEYLLMRQIQNSKIGQRLLIENLGIEPLLEVITKKFVSTNSYKNLDNKHIGILFETVIATVEKTLYKLIRKEQTIEESFNEIDLKIDIIRFGIK